MIRVFSCLLFLFATGIAYGQYERTYQGKTLEEWTQQLQDPQPFKRLTAVNVLHFIGDEGVPALVAALKNQDAAVRFKAAIVLAENGKHASEVVPVFIQLLNSKEKKDLRTLGVLALKTLGPLAKDANPALLRALKDPDIWEPAARALGSINPQGGEFVPALVEMFKDPRKEAPVSEVLSGIGKPGVPALTKALKSDQLQVRDGALLTLLSLEDLDSKERLSFIQQALKQPRLEIRKRGVSSLLKLEKEGLPLLRKALKESAYNWCNEAIRSISTAAQTNWKNGYSKLYGVTVLLLIGKTFEEDPLGDFAADTLNRIRTEDVPTLTDALQDSPWKVRCWAADCLGAMEARAKVAIPPLLQALKDTDEDVRNSALKALVAIDRNSPEVRAALAAGLKDKHSSVRLTALQALATINKNTPDVLAVLVAGLKDRHENVRMLAEDILLAMGPAAKDAVAALIGRLQDNHKDHLRTVKVLANIGPAAKEALPALRTAAATEAPPIRPFIALALLKICGDPKEGMPILLAGLQDKDEDCRRDSAVFTADFGMAATAAVPYLFELVRLDRLEEVRKSARASLVGLGKTAVPYLLEVLKDKDTNKHSWAMLLLSHLGVPAQDLAPFLLPALQSPDADVRAWAATSLAQVKPVAKDAISSLFELARFDKVEKVRKQAAESLVALGKDAVPFLVEALKDKDIKKHSWALSFLSRIGAPAQEAAPVILTALQAQDVTVRGWAAITLEKVKPAARDAVLPLFEVARLDKVESVRIQATKSLVGLGKEAVPFLVEILKDKDVKKHSWALSLLSRIGAPAQEATPAVISALQDQDATVRLWAANALGDIHPPVEAATAALQKALSDKVPTVRRAAALALGKLPPEVLPALLAVLDSPDKTLHSLIFAPVKKWGPQAKQAVPALIGILKTKTSPLRAGAIAALGNIGPDAREAIPVLLQIIEEVPAQRHSALLTLRDLEPPASQVVSALRKAMQDKDTKVRQTAAQTLGDLGKDGAAVLGQALNKETGRGEALQILVKMGPEAQSALAELFSVVTDLSPVVRTEAATALGQIGPLAKEAVPALRQALTDRNKFLQMAAALALYRISGEGKDSLPILVSHLEPANTPAASAAARALAEIGKPAREALPMVRKILQSPSGRGKVWFACAVLRLGGEPSEALPHFLENLAASRFSSNVADALVKVGPLVIEVVPKLRTFLRTEKHGVEAAMVLVRIGKEADGDLAVLAKIIKEGSDQVDRAAACLAEAGPRAKTIVPILREALQSPNGTIRRNALLALKKIAW